MSILGEIFDIFGTLLLIVSVCLCITYNFGVNRLIVCLSTKTTRGNVILFWPLMLSFRCEDKIKFLNRAQVRTEEKEQDQKKERKDLKP